MATLKRTSTAVWHGTGPKGSGSISTLSGALKEQPYSFQTRFVAEDGRAGTNPEELLAAAHASCFTMALSFALTKENLDSTELDGLAVDGEAGHRWIVVTIALDVRGSI